MNSPGRLPSTKPTPPQRGSFPLDHDGECKHAMSDYLACMKKARGFNGDDCRILAKAYLACRMDRNLMARDDFKNLGFADSSTTLDPTTADKAPKGELRCPGKANNAFDLLWPIFAWRSFSPQPEFTANMTRSTDTKSRRITPPSPAYMTNDQFAEYLADLRANRTARPGGARPQPSRQSQHRQSLEAASEATPGFDRSQARPQVSSTPTHDTSVRSKASTGRDYYPTAPTVPLKPSEVVPTTTYMERGQRWMEKEEAVSLREALQDMEIRRPASAVVGEDERRLYNAALDDAAELVWQHQHGSPKRKPDGPYRYRSHLRKNSYAHARTASVGSQGDDVAPSGLGRDVVTRSMSMSSTDSAVSSQAAQKGGVHTALEAGHHGSRSHGNTCPASRRTSLRKDISGEVQRPFSGDQIWEEPETSPIFQTASPGRASPDKLDGKSLSPMNRARLRFSQPSQSHVKAFDRVEIHRNPVTQTRNPQYKTNDASSKPVPDPSLEHRNGMEVRGQDIRAATTRRLKDRSVRLPEPTAVSDSPGRPIVSFDASWKAPDKPTDVKPDPPTQVSPPCNEPVDVPRIAISEAETPRSREISHAGLPSIAIAGPEESLDSTAVMTGRAPQPGWSGPRPLPTPGARSSQQPRGHWSPAPGAISRAIAVCHQCGLSIDGRFVSLAGGSERFHPQCFRCYSCKTSLETMEISPEPEHIRAERLRRIRLRAAGRPVEEQPGKTAADDGDERLRFFCHLDWHELFAPRCKHCKTPIIGEHIVALGHHWHYGHFFCAECGDSFGQGMTHIEKDGYAWCINCQTKRTERRAPKCRKCKQAVIGQYIQALGGEWHEHCFRCAECRGGFEDGQIFPKEVVGGTLAYCTRCRARQLKS
ncbi:hypothetical protein L249_7334 [Ophiocordyceps polyrhachis-furcata BCC 54312]|uniref:LIM zinc-binding domain-containing protein n=1 Tax=Ophiocordyceps polyrhachis-furcata BCC 54312 TaxID=1330021 RepID=A0A367LAJ5_9HYPO|nr:hypothetical protein L249_7334 [Ophiocordyceps polyrhachis-furcata BCC 54312]